MLLKTQKLIRLERMRLKRLLKRQNLHLKGGVIDTDLHSQRGLFDKKKGGDGKIPSTPKRNARTETLER